MSKQKATPRKQLDTYLARVSEINTRHGSGHYELAQIMYAINSSQLYQLNGFKTMKQFVDSSDMAISFFQCILYRDLYHWFKFHGYNKTESVEILEQCTLRGIVVALKDSNKKLSARQIKKITTEYNAAHPNFNVSLSPEVREKAEEFMHEHFGLEYTESGRRTNMTAAFLSMLEAAAKQKKVKLKLVA